LGVTAELERTPIHALSLLAFMFGGGIYNRYRGDVADD